MIVIIETTNENVATQTVNSDALTVIFLDIYRVTALRVTTSPEGVVAVVAAEAIHEAIAEVEEEEAEA